MRPIIKHIKDVNDAIKTPCIYTLIPVRFIKNEINANIREPSIAVHTDIDNF